MKKIILGAVLIATGMPALAQDNILAEKPIYTLGKPMTWTAGDESYTFITEDLQKLVAATTNTDNVFLYPENGTLNTPENQAKGPQVFYIDMETVQNIGTVTTTWEGAAADSYNIYITQDEPTAETLKTEPTFSIEGLGQYTSTTAVLPEGTQGRYLVFQVTKATNWGWGVKIRSISAFAPTDDVLTTFKVAPSIIAKGQKTPVTLTILNQFGLDMSEFVEVLVSENATYSNGELTISSGDYATFTGKTDSETLTFDVYNASAPISPEAKDIKTPIFTNTDTENNSTAEFTTAYNEGANNLGLITFENGNTAQEFTDVRCVFFSNSVTTGAWNGNINPAEKGYRNLCLDVFSVTDTECTIEFESVENLEGGTTYPFTLKAGEWNPIVVDVAGATKLGNLSIRFSEENMTDILLANIYFSGFEDTYVPEEGLYLVGSMTTQYDGGFKPNPSYMFTKQGNGDYTLEVASISSTDRFYVVSVAANGTQTSYSAEECQDMKPQGSVSSSNPTLVIDTEYEMGLDNNYLNVIFTLTPYDDSYTLTYTGTLNDDVFSITPGNDKTYQSGTVDNNSKTITMETENEAVLVYIYVPSGSTNVQYALTNVSDISSVAQAMAEETPEYKNANAVPNEENTYTVSLPVKTTGNLNIRYNSSADEVKEETYTYTVNFATPTSVEEVEFDADNAVNVFNLQGICVKKNVKASEATLNLPAGIYIIGGKKVVVTK